jgi:hypothetical protein
MPHNFLKVVFRRLHFKRNAISSTSIADLYFVVSVNGQPVGDKSVVHHIGPNGVLDHLGFEAIVDVEPMAKFDVSFQVMDQRNYVSDDDLGTLSYTVKTPFGQKEMTHSNSFWLLEWGIELMVDGKFGQHRPSEIFAARSGPGYINVNTVAGTALMSRMEINPVRPVPPDAKLPPRPAFPAGTAPAKLNKSGMASISPTDDINIIPNPAVIPILSDADASATTAAKIEYTYYRPNVLAFADDDERLTWSASAISGGASVKFFGPAKGLKVFVYGVTAGEILLEVKFGKDTFAAYRAVVGPVKKVPCRFNILNGPDAASTPRATPANIVDHLAIANRYLRQMAIELTLDTNKSVRDGAVMSDVPGIFRLRVAAGITRNVALTGFGKEVELNFRPGLMNFAYIHSTALQDPTKPNQQILGAASDWPDSKAGNSITDSGTPSTSWKVPSGIKPDANAGSVTMVVNPKRQRATPAGVAGMYVCDSNGDPSQLADQQNYANTLAHEFGHNLNLAHRNLSASAYDDGVKHPPDQNIMHWINPATIAQDFDIIQAKAARQSPLIA